MSNINIPTIHEKIFGKKQENKAKLNKTRKFWYLFLLKVWPLLPKILFWRGDWTLHLCFYSRFSFDFLISWILRPKLFGNLWGQHVYRVYYTRYQVRHYLWRIKFAQKHGKLQRYCVSDCRWTEWFFLFLFILIANSIFRNHFVMW